MLAAAMFLAFVAGIIVPAVCLARRIAPLPVAAMLVIFAFVPWFFLRKAIGMPLIVDVVTAVALLISERRRLRRLAGERPAPLVFLIPILFAVVWLGWHVTLGNEVRFYGLFAIDFGNLVSVVSTLRASPMLPLASLDGAGPLHYHWLYFTIPAALADFAGGSMSNATALALTNLLVAILLVQTVRSIAPDWRAAAIVLFAPFSTYFYQAAAARLALGPLELPTRNHLLLSPLNSMLVFGNNSIALVLAIVALTQLERWNRDGRWRDLVFGCLALAAIVGYSATLVFPVVLALVLWIGRIRRPLIAFSAAASIGACAIGMFYALHVLGGESMRPAFAFDNGAYLKMLVFGAVPLWGIALLSARRELTLFHVLAASCVVIPSILYVAGSATGAVDFSMKTASLFAIAFAPLLHVRRNMLILLLVILGSIQSAVYVLQFPFYRLRHTTTNGVAIPRDYASSLAWIREHTPRNALVVDPHEGANDDEVFTLFLAERRIWLPTAYTPPDPRRSELWRAFATGDARAGEAIAREAHVLVAPIAVASPSWREVHREGAWWICRSTLH
jgi:hypothetical protein